MKMRLFQTLASFNKAYILLTGFFLIGVLIRSINLWDNVIFSYDHARDAQRIWDILYKGDLKLVGAETDLPGVFHGALFYYVLAPFYFLGQFNPNWVAQFLIIVNALCVFPLYWITRILFKKPVIAFLASALWTVSFEQANFSRFIAVSGFVVPSTLLFFLGLALIIIKKNTKGYLLVAIGLGLSIQANFYLVYLCGVLLCFLTAFHPKLSIRHISTALLIFLVIVSSFFIAELKWSFMASRGLLQYAQHQSDVMPIITSIGKYLHRISESVYYSFFSFNMFIGFLVLVGLSVVNWSKAQERKSLTFLYLWFFSTLPLFAFETMVVNTLAINASIIGAITIIIALGIYHVFRIRSYIAIILVIAIITSNIKLFVKEDFKNYSLMSITPLFWSDIRAVVDYTYKESKGEAFSICSLSNPLFVNTLWSFSYSTYGKNTYHYLPTWSGQFQDINASNLPYEKDKTPLRYIILEPPTALPEGSREIVIYLEDHVTNLIGEKNIGHFTIQKRVLKKEGEKYVDTQTINSTLLEKIKYVISADPRYSCFVQH